jgi:hypothetical protein
MGIDLEGATIIFDEAQYVVGGGTKKRKGKEEYT